MIPTEIEKPHLSEDGEAMAAIAYQEGSPYCDGLAQASSPDGQITPMWFAAYTTPRHEKRVEQHLSRREVEHYLPIYHTPRKWRNGVKVILDLPLFTSYIFVRIKRTERVKVLDVPGVLAIVGGTAGEMAPLPDEVIDALRSGLDSRRVEPYPFLAVGQRARIRSGSLAGMEGIVVRKKNSLRVVLTMDMIQQSIAVEVDGSELEPLSSGDFAHA
jgi:transcription antitermination factor NusG